MIGLLLLVAVQQSNGDRSPAFNETHGRWRIAGDRELGACLATLNTMGPTELTVVTRPNEADLLFALNNPAWKSLKDADQSRLWAHMLTRGQITDSWNLAVSSYNGNGRGPLINFKIDRAKNDGASFVRQFAGAETISFMRDKVPVASFSLAGSKQAIDRLLACRSYLRADAGFDPFAE